MPTEVMRTKTVRKQKPVHGEEDETAILRKEETRNSESEGMEEKGREGKMR